MSTQNTIAGRRAINTIAGRRDHARECRTKRHTRVDTRRREQELRPLVEREGVAPPATKFTTQMLYYY